MYFLEQAINALILCCIYGLLAAAYTVIYALIGRINLAFGELSMIAGYLTVLGVVVLSVGGGLPLPATLALVLVLAVVITGTYGWATQHFVFTPLRHSRTHAPLIATIGLAIALQEFVRLTQGSRERWLQPVLSELHLLATVDGFAVVPIQHSGVNEAAVLQAAGDELLGVFHQTEGCVFHVFRLGLANLSLDLAGHAGNE